MPKSAFIVLEGIDGSGTTTQCGRLAAALEKRGHKVLQTREPSIGAIGKLARSALAAEPPPQLHGGVEASTLALLFAADRLDHLRREILPALDAGKVVLCDRYLLSSFAYQSLDCDPSWVEAINSLARWPDLTLVVDVDADTAFARVQARAKAGDAASERFDVPELQRKLAGSYAALTARGLPGVVRVDGNASIDDVSAALLASCIQSGL